MRTTVTLDEDVIVKLRDRMNTSGASFKQTINACLRQGLEWGTDEALERPFVVEPRPVGVRSDVDIDDNGGLIDLLDGPAQP